MVHGPSSRFAVRSLCAAFILLSPVGARGQAPDSVLTQSDMASLDSLASQVAQEIHELDVKEKEPRVLVIDFFRSSPGKSSQLGTELAYHFSDSLATYSSGMKVLERGILKDYLIESWTTLEDLGSDDVCLEIARELGATGIVLGTLTEENGHLNITLQLGGFGLRTKGKDIYPLTRNKAILVLTEEMRTMLLQPGSNYAHKADAIPEEPGVVTFDQKKNPGIKMPRCTYCPPPGYSNPARAAKFAGTVLLSVVVMPEGRATSIYVVKGAPFEMTANAIEAVQHWRFQPAENDGKPIPFRIKIEVAFRLF